MESTSSHQSEKNLAKKMREQNLTNWIEAPKAKRHMHGRRAWSGCFYRGSNNIDHMFIVHNETRLQMRADTCIFFSLYSWTRKTRVYALLCLHIKPIKFVISERTLCFDWTHNEMKCLKTEFRLCICSFHSNLNLFDSSSFQTKCVVNNCH